MENLQRKLLYTTPNFNTLQFISNRTYILINYIKILSIVYLIIFLSFKKWLLFDHNIFFLLITLFKTSQRYEIHTKILIRLHIPNSKSILAQHQGIENFPILRKYWLKRDLANLMLMPIKPISGQYCRYWKYLQCQYWLNISFTLKIFPTKSHFCTKT